MIATVIWGSTFIAQSVGMDYIGPFTFLTMRAVLAVPFLIILIFLMERNPAETIKNGPTPSFGKPDSSAEFPCLLLPVCSR